jgi:alpha-ketoglutarate-dependent taurine dioxygenase
VNDGQTAEILDMPVEEGQALLKELLPYCSDPSRVYRHKWRVGDVVMWDNLPTQHLAIADYQLPDRRYLWRTTLRGQPMA